MLWPLVTAQVDQGSSDAVLATEALAFSFAVLVHVSLRSRGSHAAIDALDWLGCDAEKAAQHTSLRASCICRRYKQLGLVVQWQTWPDIILIIVPIVKVVIVVVIVLIVELRLGPPRRHALTASPCVLLAEQGLARLSKALHGQVKPHSLAGRNGHLVASQRQEPDI